MIQVICEVIGDIESSRALFLPYSVNFLACRLGSIDLELEALSEMPLAVIELLSVPVPSHSLQLYIQASCSALFYFSFLS